MHLGTRALLLAALWACTLAATPLAEARGRKQAQVTQRRGPAQRQAEGARTDPGHVYDGRRAKPAPVDSRGVKPWGRGEREREWRKPSVQPPRLRPLPPPPPPKRR